MEKIVGIDPGGTTGMCVYVDGEFLAGEEAAGLEEVAEHLAFWNPDAIVMEDFLGGYGHVNHYDPTTIIGAVRMWALLADDVPITMQSPAILRTRLKKADGLHKSKHVRCSAAHVIHYLRRRETR